MKYPYLGFDPESFDSLFNTTRTQVELEKFLLFAICVAGKTSPTTANSLNKLFETTVGTLPMATLAYDENTAAKLKSVGIGCYNQRMRSIESYVEWSKDHKLRGASLEDLLKIKGVSHKTARFFLLYNYQFQAYAAIDTQILKVLRSKGYDAPKTTPTSFKQYKYWEDVFLFEAITNDGAQFVEGDFYARKDFDGWIAGRAM